MLRGPELLGLGVLALMVLGGFKKEQFDGGSIRKVF